MTAWKDKHITLCYCGGIGRHKGLKIPRSKIHIGSSPISSTKNVIHYVLNTHKNSTNVFFILPISEIINLISDMCVDFGKCIFIYVIGSIPVKRSMNLLLQFL